MSNNLNRGLSKPVSGNLTKKSRKKLAGHIQSAKFSLPINASTTQSEVADHAGDLQSILFNNSAIGSGMTIDVQVNAVSVLPAATPFTHSAAYPAKTEVSIPFVANTRILPGDIISVVRAAFTAGASVARVVWL